MKIRHIALLLAASFGPGVPAVAERAPEQLQLQGKWVADFDDDACHLSAQFGSGDDKVFLRLTRFEPGGDYLKVVFASNRLRSYDPRSSASIDFGVANAPIKQDVERGLVGGLPAVFFGSVRVDGWVGNASAEKPPEITPEMLKRVTGVTVAVRGTPPVRLVFQSFDQPMAVMRSCVTDLIRSWGYDPAVDASLSRRATPSRSPAEWFHTDDYPSQATAAGHNGMVQFRVNVDAAGKILGCHVIARTKPDEFGDLTCRLVLRHGRFKPALDAAGKPVPGYWIGATKWQIG